MHWVRSNLGARKEMLQDLLPAARERLWDARAALKAGSPTGSVYLAGYSVEMVLKHSALRVDRVSLTASPLSAAVVSRARHEKELGSVEPESYHSLKFWALLLRAAWRVRRNTVPAVVDTALGKSLKLYQGWTVDLRYRSGLINQSDAVEFVREASWFVARSAELA